MKYGVLIHKTTTNVGDDFQSYAAARLLPRVDYIINRETIDEFESENNETVACIMNAWWMWNKWHFPPSSCIYPKFLSFHYSEYGKDRMANNGMEFVTYQFLEGKGKDYMNYYGPIGCRDVVTMNALQELGINAYFSGCMTLTLDRFPVSDTENKKDYICLVDVSKEVEEKVRKTIKERKATVEVIVQTHFNDYRETRPDWEGRKREVERRLKLYQNARCVITRKLHCALPCLALEVPVLLVNPDFISTRFQPYYDWLHKATTKEFLNDDYDYDILAPRPNPENYLPIREQLKKQVAQFVSSMEKEPKIDRFDQNTSEFVEWRIRTMKSVLDQAHWDYREKYAAIQKKTGECSKKDKKIADLNREISKVRSDSKNEEAALKKQIQILEKEIEKRDKILNARMIKPVVKLRKKLEKTGLFKKKKRS